MCDLRLEESKYKYGPSIYLLVNPDGQHYVGMASCVAMRVAFHGVDKTLGTLGEAKLAHPWAGWRKKVLFKSKEQRSRTLLHIFESILITSCLDEKRLNSSVWDMQFVQLPGEYRGRI